MTSTAPQAERNPTAAVATLTEGIFHDRNHSRDGATALRANIQQPQGDERVSRVLGIDPSLTGAGFAVVESLGSWKAETWSSGRKGKRNESLPQRSARISLIVSAIDQADLSSLTAAGIEAPAYGAPGGSTWDRAHLWWSLIDRLLHANVPVVLITSSTRQKFATGHSHSNKNPVDKSDVAMAVSRMWPDTTIVGNDCADALVIASIVAARLGLTMPFPMPAYRSTALSAVAVPTVATAR